MLAAAALLCVFNVDAAFACGPDSDCLLGERTYRIQMPANHDGKTVVGAVIFNHGYRGTTEGVMAHKELTQAISDLGLVLVAPKSSRDDWDIPNAPFNGPRTEITFFDALKQDLVSNHFVDPGKIMVSGFSAGGMVSWQLACERGGDYVGFAPISGTFWAPVPDECPAFPTNIIHVHGTADKVVPMEGRPIGSALQSNVYDALKLAVQTGNFAAWRSIGEADGLTCQERRSDTGKMLQLCIHPGGHMFKPDWIVRAWKEFEKAGAMGN